MRSLVKIVGEQAVPVEFDLSFVLGLDDETYKGLQKIFNRLASIESVLGGEYDLDRLRELVEIGRDGRYELFPPKAENEFYMGIDVSDYWPEDLIPQKVLDAMRDNFREIHRLPLLGITSLPAEEVQAKLKEAESE